MDRDMKESILTIALFGLVLGAYSMAAQPYTCQPYQPKSECELSRYEIHVHDVTMRSKKIIAVAETACVYSIGEGKSKRYVATDAEFTAANRTDYFEKVEFPAAQSLVCRVQ